MKRIAPIFSVRRLEPSMAHYHRLGFSTRTYEGGGSDGYGFVTRDGIEIHLGVVPEAEAQRGAAYLFVADADQLAET